MGLTMIRKKKEKNPSKMCMSLNWNMLGLENKDSIGFNKKLLV